MGAMGAAEPLQSVLWVKRQRCTVSLEPARALLRWWRSPEPGPSAPGAGKCGHPGLAGRALHLPLACGARALPAGWDGAELGGRRPGARGEAAGAARRGESETQSPGAGRSKYPAASGGEPSGC